DRVVRVDLEGVTLRPTEALDPTRPCADVELTGARIDVLAVGAADGVARWRLRALLANAAEQAGVCRTSLTLATEYAKVRVPVRHADRRAAGHPAPVGRRARGDDRQRGVRPPGGARARRRQPRRTGTRHRRRGPLRRGRAPGHRGPDPGPRRYRLHLGTRRPPA